MRSDILCAVARNVIANRARQAKSERRIRATIDLDALPSADDDGTALDQDDAFYSAWAEDLLQSTVESLLDDYHREDRCDYFRVLYGRICEGLSVPAIAEDLGIKVTSAENHYKHARRRLGQKLETLVQAHVRRYTPPDEFHDELQSEWGRLGRYLDENGGLEEVIRRSYDQFDAEELRRREATSMTSIVIAVQGYLGSRE